MKTSHGASNNAKYGLSIFNPYPMPKYQLLAIWLHVLKPTRQSSVIAYGTDIGIAVSLAITPAAIILSAYERIASVSLIVTAYIAGN